VQVRKRSSEMRGVSPPCRSTLREKCEARVIGAGRQAACGAAVRVAAAQRMNGTPGAARPREKAYPRHERWCKAGAAQQANGEFVYGP